MNDIVIIGAGIIGCSIAREMSRYKLNITVVEKNLDVAEGISKGNSGIIHAGFNEKQGTLKSKLNIKGNKMFDELSSELEFPFKRNGALVLAFNDDECNKIRKLKDNGRQLGVEGLHIIKGEQAQLLEKSINENVKEALYAETSGIVNPYDMTIAMAENAADNGVQFKFGSKVINILKNDEYFDVVLENKEVIKTRFIINAAGINGAEVNNMINDKKYKIQTLKGEYCLFDKIAGSSVNKTLFQVPGEVSKGVLVTPTVDGNLLIGPNAEEDNTLSTSRKGIDEIIKKASRSVKELPKNRIITSFSGLRPKCADGDFIIESVKNNENFINVIGIDSPGLTCAPAIAKYVANLISKNLIMIKKHDFKVKRHKMIRFAELNDDERNKLISKNPAYGKMVCKCELVTEGEIIDSIKRKLGAKTIDGVKRRTRAMMGGCQGMGCTIPISKIMSRELNVDISDIRKNSKDSPVIGFKEE